MVYIWYIPPCTVYFPVVYIPNASLTSIPRPTHKSLARQFRRDVRRPETYHGHRHGGERMALLRQELVVAGIKLSIYINIYILNRYIHTLEVQDQINNCLLDDPRRIPDPTTGQSLVFGLSGSQWIMKVQKRVYSHTN